jgi:uncharacterized Rossmann fold enzyme
MGSKDVISISPIWRNETVYLVGGGPSLKGMNWDMLRGKRTIAINRAFQAVPWADVLYWTDAQFYRWYRRDIDRFHGMKVCCRPLEAASSMIMVLQGVREKGIDMRPTHICDGNNSGYGALNLAVKMGANRIFLLGFDMHSQEGATHWHNGYSRKHNHSIYKRVIAYFESAVPALEELGVEVWNANPDSHLNCFKKCSLQSAIEGVPMLPKPDRFYK